MWERLCGALGLAELGSDPRAASNEARVRNRRLVDAAVAAAVSGLSSAAVVERLNAAGVLVAPVRSAARAVEDPQVGELGLIDEIDGVRFAASPLNQFNPGPLSPARRLGEDSAGVLAEYLAIDGEELASLVDSGVVETAADAGAPPPATAGTAQAAST